MHLLYVESNVTGVAAIQTMLDEGHHVTLFTADKNYYFDNAPQIISALENPRFYLIQSSEIAEVERCVNFGIEYAQNQPIDGVMTFSEFHIVHAAALAQALHLPGMNVEAAGNARHKHRTRKVLKDYPHIPQPEFRHVTSTLELRSAAQDIGFPCVVKPSDGTASLAVVMLANASEFEAYFEELSENERYGRGLVRGSDLVVEEYVSGELVSVEACVHGGIVSNMGITDRHLSGFPHFIEMGCCYFSEHPLRNELFELNIQILDALGINFGFIHTEFILSKKGPVLCEVNGRLVGGIVPTLMKVSTGIDPLREASLQALGKLPNLSIVHDVVAAGRWFGSPSKGEVRDINLSKLENGEGFVEAKAYRRPGEKVNCLSKSNYDWLGHVVFKGSCRETASLRAERSLDEIDLALNLSVAR